MKSIPYETICQAKGVFRSLYGARLTDQQAEIFLLIDEEMQRAVVRPGRSVGRMLAQLVMRPETPRDVRKPQPARPSEDEAELRLGSMSGYGEARQWGMQLAADRILDDLWHVAYRRGRQSPEVFKFLDQDLSTPRKTRRWRRTT